MDIARLFADALRERAQKGDHVMAHLGLDGAHTVQVIAGGPDLWQRREWDRPARGPGFADGDLHAQPRIILCLVRPYGGHLWPAVPFDHPSLVSFCPSPHY